MDYYSDAEEGPMDKGMMGKPEAEEPEGEPTGTLVPKSLFSGQDLKPGDTVTLKVVHAFEDEYEVAPETSTKTNPEPTVNEEIDRMAGEGED